MTTDPDPHRGQRTLTAGRALPEAAAVMLLVHGRGASAGSILQLGVALNRPDIHLLAPEAAGNTWYPHTFLAPLEKNEPYLGSALRLLAATVDSVIEEGVSAERLLLLGFSQGACLTLEFIARNPRRYGGVAALTGGLIGPDEAPRDYPGSLDGTPIFLGTSDPDPHVPRIRVEESAKVLERMGAKVETRIYPGMPHTINEDEMEHVRSLIDGVIGATDDR